MVQVKKKQKTVRYLFFYFTISFNHYIKDLHINDYPIHVFTPKDKDNKIKHCGISYFNLPPLKEVLNQCVKTKHEQKYVQVFQKVEDHLVVRSKNCIQFLQCDDDRCCPFKVAKKWREVLNGGVFRSSWMKDDGHYVKLDEVIAVEEPVEFDPFIEDYHTCTVCDAQFFM